MKKYRSIGVLLAFLWSALYATPLAAGDAPPPPADELHMDDAEVSALRSITTVDDAEQFLEQHCPHVALSQNDGEISYYKPDSMTIELAEHHTHPDRIGYIFTHELAHHYQFTGGYERNQSGWNDGLASGVLEEQADHMTYILYGQTYDGAYTTTPPTYDESRAALYLINRGAETC